MRAFPRAGVLMHSSATSPGVLPTGVVVVLHSGRRSGAHQRGSSSSGCTSSRGPGLALPTRRRRVGLALGVVAAGSRESEGKDVDAPVTPPVRCWSCQVFWLRVALQSVAVVDTRPLSVRVSPHPQTSSTPPPSASADDQLAERLKALKAQQADATRGPAAAKLGGASSSDEAAAASATSNPVEGALEEARLISWPAVSSVLGSTAVVLGIVVASTLLILAVNSLLATTSEALFG